MEYVPLDFAALYYITRQGSYENWELIQDEPLVIKETKHNRYFEVDIYGYKEEVFPTEITKIVYLPKELC